MYRLSNFLIINGIILPIKHEHHGTKIVAFSMFCHLFLKLKDSFKLFQLTMFWKSILHEFATKEGGGLPLPSYCTVPAGGTSPYFVSHTKYKEVTYPAMSGRSKKEAEQLAACVTIQTLLGIVHKTHS